MTRTAIRDVKHKTCKACGGKFRPSLSTQKACSVKCALDLAKQPEGQKVARKAIADRDRRELRVRKERLKSRADYMREAQAVFNQWVRLRDADQPCISCGRHHERKYDAGHYRTVGSNPALRFEPLNCHKQCVHCNQHKSGDIVNYRINLVQRIGAQAVAWIEGPHEAKRYTIEDLKAIKAEYKSKIKAIKEAA